MKDTIPSHILWVLETLNQHHKEAFLVGGCVRDMLMHREIHDYDITTNAKPRAVMEIFKKLDCLVVPTGMKHGTISVQVKEEWVEITTYRIEQEYVHHRFPAAVLFTDQLTKDLERRDFTMNAIAYHPSLGFVDPFHGQKDIQQGIIRCVGEPKKRFEEDALRILRALRFSCTLHFIISEDTQKAIHACHSLLAYISKERIRSEFDKILVGDYPNTLSMLRTFGVLPYILPGYHIIYDHEQKTPWHTYDIFTHTDLALNHTKGYPLESKLAIIFHDVGKPESESFDEAGIAHYKRHALYSKRIAESMMKELTYSRTMIQHVCTLILYHDYYVKAKRTVLRKFLSKFDNDFALAMQVLDVQIADDFAKNMDLAQEKIDIILESKQLLQTMVLEQDYLSLKDLCLNGHDIIALGYRGKEIKDALQFLYEIVLLDPNQNTKETLKQCLLERQL